MQNDIQWKDTSEVTCKSISRNQVKYLQLHMTLGNFFRWWLPYHAGLLKGYGSLAKMRKFFCRKMPSRNQHDKRRVAQPIEKLMQTTSSICFFFFFFSWEVAITCCRICPLDILQVPEWIMQVLSGTQNISKLIKQLHDIETSSTESFKGFFKTSQCT